MRLLLHWPLRKLSFLSFSTSGLRMASKQLLNLVFSPITSKPVSKIRPLCLRTNGYSSLSPAHVAEPVELEKPEENGMSSIQMRILKEKLENLGIHGETMSVPRQYNHLICPVCKGGDSEEKSLHAALEKKDVGESNGQRKMITSTSFFLVKG
ncbi:hypothetical protein ACFXTH_036377 [Malus domestica]